VAGTIKIRTELNGDLATVRLLVKHPMNVGGKRKDGTEVAPHFIKEITCTHNGEVVLLGHWGGGVARNPYLSFSFNAATAGDELAVRWLDNQGARDEFKTRL
jgi:sulfur-oxidizing protein SoxZ